MSKKIRILLAAILATTILCTKINFDDVVSDLDDANKDTKAPVIFLSVDDPDYVVVNSANSYEFTATAFDTTIDTVIDYSDSINIINNVNTSIVDTYYVYLSVSDVAGNMAYDTLTVIVSDSSDIPEKDTTPPVVTLIGLASIQHPINTAFQDPGAVAIDNVDDTVEIQKIGFEYLKTDEIGTYQVGYWAQDSAGNISDTIKRYIFVVNETNNEPTITITGANPLNIKLGTSYTQPNVSADDLEDGDLTSSIEVSGDSVDVDSEGTYLVIFTVTDSDDNEVSDTLKVIVSDNTQTDTTPPVITISGSNPLSVDSGTAFNEPTVTANDETDGDVTASIVKSGDTVDTNTVGTYLVIYTASDAAGNEAKDTLTVYIIGSEDNIAPVITISGNNPLSIDSGTAFSEPTVTANDETDGDVSASIVKSGDTVDTNTVDTYLVIYTASDAAGNEAKDTLTVIVKSVSNPDNTAPVITIPNPNPMTIDSGTGFTEPTVTANDETDGDVSGNITKTGVVDTNSVGTYLIIYTVDDAAGNEAKDTLTVNVVSVEDTEAPVISITGSNPDTVWVGESWTEPSVSALDNVDGSVSVTKSDSTVNTAVAGNYHIIYTASDVAGNEAKDTLNVLVIADTEAPVITISGNNPLSVDSAGTYSNPSATALDNKDGSIADGSITKTGTVNVNTLGTYNIIYSVSDAAGNEGKDTLVVNVVSTSNDPCAGESDWSNTEPWTAYTTGDYRVHNNKLWELTGIQQYGAYEPGTSTSNALNAWTFVDDCNP